MEQALPFSRISTVMYENGPFLKQIKIDKVSLCQLHFPTGRIRLSTLAPFKKNVFPMFFSGSSLPLILLR